MDTGRTTLLMLAAAAAITVAARAGRHRQACVAEADRIATCVSWLTTGQRELRKGQKDMIAALGRLEAMTADLLEIGDQAMSHHQHQTRAVAGAYEALQRRPDEVGQARRLRKVRNPEG